MEPSSVYEQVVAWWAQWVPEDKRDAFEAALLKRIDGQESVTLYADYDPRGDLFEAVREAGMECRGYMFSNKDVGFPNKTGTKIEYGLWKLKEGYGAPWVTQG